MSTGLDMLADLLVEADSDLLRSLIDLREAKGITPAQMEERCGWAPGTLALFEHYAADPKLSELRRYALAVGVRIRHNVTDFDLEGLNGAD